MSVTKKKDKKLSRENSPLPIKQPELKLSVRKLLGCTPSPPPIIRERSISPDDHKIHKNQHTKLLLHNSANSLYLQDDIIRGWYEFFLLLCYQIVIKNFSDILL